MRASREHTVRGNSAEMYRVCCMRRANKENAASFMLRVLLLWTKMLSFSRERGGKCGRLSNAGGFVVVPGRSAYQGSWRGRKYAGLDGFFCAQSCFLGAKCSISTLLILIYSYLSLFYVIYLYCFIDLLLCFYRMGNLSDGILQSVDGHKKRDAVRSRSFVQCPSFLCVSQRLR